MADAMIEYKKELNHKDIIEIAVVATDFDKLGFDIYYRVTVLENGEHQLAVRAKTGMMLYDYTAKKKVSLPENIIQQLG
jgi:acyl-CoA thioesterase FadM